MRLILPAVAALALGWSIYAAQSASPAPHSFDLDGDGQVSILDMTLLAQHFGEPVGTPTGGCYTIGSYVTPLSEDGYTFSRYVLLPQDHPAAAGTPIALSPC